MPEDNSRCSRRTVGVLGVIGVVGTSMAAASCAQDDGLWEAARTVASVGRVGGAPAVADVDGDGNLDLVVPGADAEGGSSGGLIVFIGDGDGGFRRHGATTDLPFPGTALWLAVGDVNEDGRPDAVVGQHDSYELAILLGDGEGGFDAAPEGTVAAHDGPNPHTHSVAVADVSGDGHADILTTCADDDAVAVLLGDGAGGFERAPGSPFDAGEQPYEGLGVGLVDGDENPDAVVANLWGSAVTVLLGDGSGRLERAPGSPVGVGARPGFVALGDLDGDGHADVVATHDETPVVDVLLADAAGALRPAPGSPVPVAQRVWGAVVADVDGDGNTDVVLGGSVDRVIVLLGDGRGGFGAEQLEVRMPRAGPGRVRVADLDGDGKPDLIVSYWDASVVDVCFGR